MSVEVGDKAPHGFHPAGGRRRHGFAQGARRTIPRAARRRHAPSATRCPTSPRWKAAIVGVSRDSVASHDLFKQKFELPFPLASDEDGKVCRAYGVWVEKSMYGRK